MVDHIDKNKLNNNVDNLRWVTRSQNCLNSKDRKSKWGRYISKHSYRWFIQVNRKINGKRKCLSLSLPITKTHEEVIIIRNTFLEENSDFFL